MRVGINFLHNSMNYWNEFFVAVYTSGCFIYFATLRQFWIDFRDSIKLFVTLKANKVVRMRPRKWFLRKTNFNVCHLIMINFVNFCFWLLKAADTLRIRVICEKWFFKIREKSKAYIDISLWSFWSHHSFIYSKCDDMESSLSEIYSLETYLTFYDISNSCLETSIYFEFCCSFPRVWISATTSVFVGNILIDYIELEFRFKDFRLFYTF